MSQNILVLGKGYIGNYLYKNLNVNFNIIQQSKKDIDYRNPYILEKYLNDNNFDWIINCSGYTGVPNVDSCEDNREECYYYNVTVPLYITKVANKLNIPIIHIGSGCVYTDYKKVYTEKDLTNFGAANFESSFYSKTKDTFEKLSSEFERYIFRIRIPFNEVVESKNYLYKLLNYNNLISYKNSITNVNDLINFIEKFVEIKQSKDSKLQEIYNYSVFNVTNNGAISAYEVVKLFKKYDLENPNWKFIETNEANFRVARSNCVLDSIPLQKFNLTLPDVHVKIEECIKIYANTINNNI